MTPAGRFTTDLDPTAAKQYVAVAVHYDALTFPQLAAFFYRQAVEERGHAMMMIQYLLDAGERPIVPGVAAPRTDFADVVEPIRIALEQERRVTDQISGLAAIARTQRGDRLTGVDVQLHPTALLSARSEVAAPVVSVRYTF